MECPICRSQLKEKQESPQGKDATFYSCPLCGNFLLSGSLVATVPHLIEKNKDANIKLSHALRSMQKTDNNVELYTNTAKEIIKNPLPSPKEQADLFIRWLAENTEGPGETIWVEPSTHKSIIGAKSSDGFSLIIEHLFNSGLVIGDIAETFGNQGSADVTLSFDGWDYYEKLLQGRTNYRKAFMAMKFGDPTLEKVLNEIFKPCIKQAGFDLFKQDDVLIAGLIDDRMRVEIQSSDFLIADLTHDNHGAYWEAGYAEGLGKPVIYTCEKEKFNIQKTHFDTNHHLTIVWDKESPQKAGEDLKATIRATLPHIAKQTDE